jgi:transcription elongation factor GreA
VAGEDMRFLLGSREVAGDGIEVYSEKSPLGAAILGHKKGYTASYKAPNGNKIAVEIIDIEPFNGG